MTELPEDVRAALLRDAKKWLLTHYAGGKRKLQAWTDEHAHYVSIRSYELPGDRAKNLRRLTKLADAGLLLEGRRYQRTGTRRFSLPQPLLDELGRQAQREWEAVGYVVGQMMDPIQEPAPCPPSN